MVSGLFLVIVTFVTTTARAMPGALWMPITKRGMDNRYKSGDMDVHTRCNLLYNAYQDVINAAQSNLAPGQQYLLQHMMRTSGVNIQDPSKVRAESCRMAAVTSIGDLARQMGMTEGQMRQQYPMFVRSVNDARRLMRQYVNSPYLGRDTRRLYRAFLMYFDTFDAIGLLNLW